jgi:hypothetical protein
MVCIRFAWFVCSNAIQDLYHKLQGPWITFFHLTVPLVIHEFLCLVYFVFVRVQYEIRVLYRVQIFAYMSAIRNFRTEGHQPSLAAYEPHTMQSHEYHAVQFLYYFSWAPYISFSRNFIRTAWNRFSFRETLH